ncbi:hypothetical protein E2C01_033167 [Portunus trituberculatus]|uniref:Uncharacterized protein n=1 Tax=Portunus trituberculatus TaxID=210409 RepID=A0A5B7EZF6_PORTR|nr:hypothetical protein [Portunus trituberculatus]
MEEEMESDSHLLSPSNPSSCKLHLSFTQVCKDVLVKFDVGFDNSEGASLFESQTQKLLCSDLWFTVHLDVPLRIQLCVSSCERFALREAVPSAHFTRFTEKKCIT